MIFPMAAHNQPLPFFAWQLDTLGMIAMGPSGFSDWCQDPVFETDNV